MNVIGQSKTIEVRKDTEGFDKEQNEEATANFSPARELEDLKDQSIEININNFDHSTPVKNQNLQQSQVEILVNKLEHSRNNLNTNHSPDNKHSYKRLQRHLHQILPEQVYNVDFYSKSIDQSNFTDQIKQTQEYLIKEQPQYISNKLRGGINGTEKYGGAIVLTTA